MSSHTVFRTLLLSALLGPLAAANAAAQTAYRWVDKSGHVHYSDQPPPADAGQVEEKRLGGASVIDTSGPDYATRTAAANFPVTLYTSADCQDECRQARDFLARRHIPYGERLMRSSEDAEAYKRATGQSEVFVPSLAVGSRFQRGFLESSWNALLDVAGYPGAGR
jgi:glutaredoxin